ncbi:DUF7537 family lipoprotein [Halomarina litorea]|uniref:DUF7537 family lipoprotein n=1 Tax=Halomarina litorea TaxID=2961595 RepID=UPI0020C53119|nr:hypothetical protein [Halomarina sp. BCD28]
MRLVRQTATLCCIALVLLAGCSGVPGFGGGGEAYTAADEPLNTSTLQEDHTENLRDAGSFTVTLNGSSAVGNDTSSQQTVIRADLEANRTYQRSQVDQSLRGQSSGVVSELYLDNGSGYARFVLGSGNQSQAQYQTVDLSQLPPGSSAPSERFLTLDQSFAITEGANWTQQGTESFRGTTVTRYTIEGDYNESALTGGTAANVSDFEATLLVTADGTVRSFGFNATVEQQGRTVNASNTIVVSDIGSTSVEEPDWLDEARNATGNRSGAQGQGSLPA